MAAALITFWASVLAALFFLLQTLFQALAALCSGLVDVGKKILAAAGSVLGSVLILLLLVVLEGSLAEKISPGGIATTLIRIVLMIVGAAAVIFCIKLCIGIEEGTVSGCLVALLLWPFLLLQWILNRLCDFWEWAGRHAGNRYDSFHRIVLKNIDAL